MASFTLIKYSLPRSDRSSDTAHLVVHDCIDEDRDGVFSEDLLWGNIVGLGPHVNLLVMVNTRNYKEDSRPTGSALQEPSQSEYNRPLVLLGVKTVPGDLNTFLNEGGLLMSDCQTLHQVSNDSSSRTIRSRPIVIVIIGFTRYNSIQFNNIFKFPLHKFPIVLMYFL